MDDPGVVLFTLGNLHSLLRMHWDHEPTPNPSQEGTGQDADECLLPSWEGSGVGRFMERFRGGEMRIPFERITYVEA